MIRIPTGTIPKNTARNISLVLGLLTGAASVVAPQYSGILRELAALLAGLGLTLGKA